jgi:ParB/RepB/Spo0J family partition protein
MIHQIPLVQIVESPFNPRRQFDPQKLKELADSIGRRGVDTPVLCRPSEKFNTPAMELVYGHRRLRAARMAGLTDIPSQVRTMTDAEVREAQMEENAQREDIHPMEEAEAFQAMLDLDKKSVQEIADRLGKSVAFIYARLKLLALGEPARSAFYENKLTPSTALLLARIPNEALQKKALKEILDDNYAPMNAREVSDHIRRNYMLRLANAPFDRGDANLAPPAGACVACPKRTGAQRELFADIEGKEDLCIDPTCWTKKVASSWEAKVAGAKDGQRVLSKQESSKLFYEGLGSQQLRYDAPYLDLSAHCHEDAKNRTYKQLLGRGFVPVLARAPDGHCVELAPKNELKKLLKQAGHEFKSSDSSTSLDLKKERAARELRGKVAAEALKQMRAEIERSFWKKPEVWEFLLLRLRNNLPEAFEVHEFKTEVDVQAFCRKGDLAGALALLFAIEMDGLIGYHTEYNKTLKQACELFGVDLKQIERELTQPTVLPEAKAAKQGAARPGKAKSIKPAKAKKVLPGTKGEKAKKAGARG